MQNRISIFSFFSGIGILDLAFERNGYNIVFVNEYDSFFLESYQYARTQMNQRDPLKVMPIFLVSVPFDAITRVSTAAFYATEKSVLSYVLTFIESIIMLVLMLMLPPVFGGQIMIWWSTVFAKVITASVSIVLSVRYSAQRNR